MWGFCTFLGARNQISQCGPDHSPRKGCRGDSVLPLPAPGASLAHGSICPSSTSISTCLSPGSLWSSPFLSPRRTVTIRFRAHPNQDWSHLEILTYIKVTKPFFQIRSYSEVLGGPLSWGVGRGTIQLSTGFRQVNSLTSIRTVGFQSIWTSTLCQSRKVHLTLNVELWKVKQFLSLEVSLWPRYDAWTNFL